MNDVLAKYTRRVNGDEDDADSLSREVAEDFLAFGWLRGIKARASMVELHKRTGHILAVGYSWIDKVEFEPGDTVTLHLSAQRIVIKGRGLNAELRPGVRLFAGLCRNKITCIMEADQSMRMEPREPVILIDDIEW